MSTSAHGVRRGARLPLRYLLAIIAACALLIAALAVVASAAPGTATVSGVLTPLNGVWLDSADGGHYWDVSARGICRVDDTANGAVERRITCDRQSKKPTQAAVSALQPDGTYFLYVSDMSTKSIGPLRLVYDPSGDSGAGQIVPNSANLMGGVNTTGFFTSPVGVPPGRIDDEEITGSYRNSSVALGPCSATITTPCTALYVAFLRSRKIERINYVDQPEFDQSIETISASTDVRKGVRYGLADFRNADGTDDLYITELGSEGVSVVKDVATCTASQGTPLPGTDIPPVDKLAGCGATLVPGIATNFAQGIAVQDNPDGTGRYLYVGDSPPNSTATVLRYHPDTGFEDSVSSTVTPYDSLLNPGETVSTYTVITGLAVDPHNGDVFVADTPTQLDETAVGHIFRIAGDSTQTAPADCTGSASQKCLPPIPPGTVTAGLYAYGATDPTGGLTFLPSDDGGHVWMADKFAGLCRFDVVSEAPELHASDPSSCDDGKTLGAGGQAVYDDSVVPGTTNQHYVYVAQTNPLSPGVLRFTFDPSANSGAGGLVANSAVVMAPGAGLTGDQANGLALGPCITGAPATCRHSLYVAGQLDPFIRRIDNPEDDPSTQTVDIVATTATGVAGNVGKGINGSIGMLGDDLYLAETKGFSVVRMASTCGVHNVLCFTAALNIGTFGVITGSAIAVDANPQHSVAGLVYASESPDSARATVYQYDVATNTARLYTSVGEMPPAGTAAATVHCTLTCIGPADPKYAPGDDQVSLRFAQGLFVNPTGDDGTLFITDDSTGGTRAERGHIWASPFMPYPSGSESVALPGPDTSSHTCAVTVPVPALAQGQSYWVQFLAHDAGPLTSTWQTPVEQSAQLVLHPGNPYAGQADPLAGKPASQSVARQVSANSRDFSVTTAPTTEPAGTYTAEFYNGGPAFGATTATIAYSDDAGTVCPTSPVTTSVVN